MLPFPDSKGNLQKEQNQTGQLQGLSIQGY